MRVNRVQQGVLIHVGYNSQVQEKTLDIKDEEFFVVKSRQVWISFRTPLSFVIRLFKETHRSTQLPSASSTSATNRFPSLTSLTCLALAAKFPLLAQRMRPFLFVRQSFRFNTDL